jgi:hypothetical protein
MYTEGGKPTPAADALMKSILEFNPKGGRGAWRAWALLSESSDKANKTMEAVQHLQRAWELQGKTSFELGAKLAMLLGKCGKHTDAIRIAHTVVGLMSGGNKANSGMDNGSMEIKMKKEVLDYSRRLLRP